MTAGFERLAINHATVPRWTTEEVIAGAARAGYCAVGLWRDRIAECGAGRAARLAHAAGLNVSSLCRGGWFCAPDALGRRARMLDNFRAVDEAAELGASVLVLVCGPSSTKDLETGRRQVAEAVVELADYAASLGIPLAIEPMHPLYCGDRSVVVTLEQAITLARSVTAHHVGVIVDSYHLWWDPLLATSISDATGRIFGFQIADWLAPPPDPLHGRGMLGDGTIDLRRFRELVDATGYSGPIEVEIFNPSVWALDPDHALQLIGARYLEHVA